MFPPLLGRGECKRIQTHFILMLPVAGTVMTKFYVTVTALFTPQLAGEARQLGCPKIVLDHVCVCVCVCVCVYIYIYICMYAPQCLSTRCIGGTSIGDALATRIQAPAGPCKLMNIAIPTNCIKYQMLHVSLI